MNAAAVFFVNFIRLVESLEPVREVLSRQGYNLVQYSLQAIAGIAPRSYLSAFTDILGALNTHCVGFLSQWLEVSRLAYILMSVCLSSVLGRGVLPGCFPLMWPHECLFSLVQWCT